MVGCTTASVAPTGLTLPALKLAPSSMGVNLTLVQRLTLVRVKEFNHMHKDAPRSLEALLEINADQVQLAAIALGQRVLTLTWDGSTLQVKRHALLPAEVDGVHVLRDVQLVYWPEQAVRASLPSGWTIEDQAQTRILAHAGETQVEIKYSGVPSWSGRVELDNRLEGYVLTIDSQVQETGPDSSATH